MWKRWKMWINFKAAWRKSWEILTECNIKNETSYPQFDKKYPHFFKNERAEKMWIWWIIIVSKGIRLFSAHLRLP